MKFVILLILVVMLIAGITSLVSTRIELRVAEEIRKHKAAIEEVVAENR